MREQFSRPWAKSEIKREIESGVEEYELGTLFEYSDFLAALNENAKISEKDTEQIYSGHDTIKKLEALARGSLAVSVDHLLYSGSRNGSNFLTGRLERYCSLVERGEAETEDIKRGLRRDIMYAAMQDTPEMGALKIADKNIRKTESQYKKENKGNRVAELFGYYSGIYKYQHTDSEKTEIRLGVYPELILMYQNARSRAERLTKKFKLPAQEEEIEHRAVLMMADWLVSMNEEYGRIYYSQEHWNYRQKEAFAWAQLGDGIKNRISLMRAKMPGHALDFHNIERFIGKSGNNKYEGERRKIYGQIKFLKNATDPDKKSFVERENEFAVQELTKWYRKEIERLRHKGDEAAIAELERVYVAQISYLQNRGAEEVLSDLGERQNIVVERYEKCKSLAEKAFDLHFHFNHQKTVRILDDEREFEEKKHVNLIDWINKAPFGTIKRAHEMMRKGISDESIIRVSFADTYGDKKTGLTRDVLENDFFLNHLIAANKLEYFLSNRSEFEEISNTDVAHKLLDAGKFESWFRDMDGFDASVADRIIESRMGLLIAENPSRFINLDEEKILNELLEKLSRNDIETKLLPAISGFTSINHIEAASKFISLGIISTTEDYVARQYGHGDMARILIKEGEVDSFEEYITKFNFDDNKIVDALLRTGQTDFLVSNLHSYPEYSINVSVARALMEKGEIENVVHYLRIFKDLDQMEVVNFLFAAGKYDIFFKNAEKFSDINFTDLVQQLIDAGKADDVASSIPRFRNADNNAIANKLIDTKNSYCFENYLSRFKNLDVSVARRLIAEKGYGSVLRSPGSFVNLDEQEIILKAIENKEFYTVAENIGKFHNIDHGEVAMKIITQDSAGCDYVAQFLPNFRGINHVLMANVFIEHGRGGAIASYLRNFEGINHNEIAKKLIQQGLAGEVANHLSNFQGLDSSVADSLDIAAVARSINSFVGLSSSVASKIIETGNGLNILNHIGSFEFLDAPLIERLIIKASMREISGMAKNSLCSYFLGNTNVVMELMESGKDNLAFKIGSVGVIFDAAALSQFPEHMVTAYKIGYSGNLLNEIKPLIAINNKRSPVTIRSILRGLEDQKLGKNFRESIEYLFNAADADAKDMINEIIRTDHKSAPRIVRTLVQIDAMKGTRYAIDLIRRSGTPDKLFAYFVHFLAKSGGTTKNAPEFLKVAGNLPVMRRIIAQNPNQFDTTLDTCKTLGINNLEKESEILFSALEDISSLTPKIYEKYRSLNGAKRKEFVEWINKQKEELFENKKINFGAIESADASGFTKDRDIIIEIIHQAYNPIGMNFESVKHLLSRVEDRTSDLSGYALPEKGYAISFSDVAYRLRKNETLNVAELTKLSQILQYRDIESMPPDELLAYNKKRDTAFARLARATTDFSEEEMGMFFKSITSHESIRSLSNDIKAKNGAYDYPVLARMHEAFGIFAKDNLPCLIESYIQSQPDLDKRINKIFDDPARRIQILKILKVDSSDVDGVSDKTILGRMIAERIFEKTRSFIKKEMRKFQRDIESEGEESGEYRAYISKNQGSFFAKAAAGICTAQDISLWNMKNHFHINIIDDKQTVQGNIQGYFETVNGNPSLVLRGFNPTETLLKTASPDSFMKTIIKVIKEFSAANHIGSTYITEHLSGYHADSNRTQIQEYNRKHIYTKVEPIRHHMKISGGKSLDNIYPL